MNRRAVIFTLAILLLAAASTWLSRRTPQEVPHAAEADHAPDYFIRSFTVTEMGRDGRPLDRLNADELEHYPSTGTILVDEPHMTLFRPREAPWELYAKTGRMEEARDVVKLTGGVRLFRTGPESVRLNTESLTVFPKREYAETGDPLTITGEKGTISAVGMDAYLAEERLVLRSRIRGRYAP